MTDVFPVERDASTLEADRLGDHPHPREVLWFGGDRAQELALLDAYRSGRLHHAWLLTGPEGVGKATLAYRFARFLLANPDPSSQAVQEARDLSVPERHPVVGQVARQSHPDLSVIRRQPTKDGKSLKGDIAVEDVRDGLALFRTTAGAGGWRVVVIDAADDLNRSSANALLKMLEEPPQRAVFLMIAHRPGALLATIRSRCRVLRLGPLPEATVADGLVRLADAAPDVAAAAAAKAEGSLRQAFAALDPPCARCAAISRSCSRIRRGSTARRRWRSPRRRPARPRPRRTRRCWKRWRRICGAASLPRLAATGASLPLSLSYGRS